MSVHYAWEFKEVSSGGKVTWYREFVQFTTPEEALEKYKDVVDNCTNCQGHRIVRVELDDKNRSVMVTRVYSTFNSKPAEIL